MKAFAKRQNHGQCVSDFIGIVKTQMALTRARAQRGGGREVLGTFLVRLMFGVIEG